MASARVEVAALLATAVPDGWDVDDHVHDLDGLEPDRPRVMVGTTNVAPGPALGLRAATLRLVLVEPTTDPGDADDALESRLEVLLNILDTLPLVAWTDAERATFADTWPAYQITLNVATTKEQ